MKLIQILIAIIWGSINLHAQYQGKASFVATLGTDTVIIETYNMLPGHLNGKAFLRYPRDQVAVFDFHFYPDGSIRHYSISYMHPDSSYLNLAGIEGLFCENDTCTWFYSGYSGDAEYRNKRQVSHMDFIGGWTPTLSLIEWNCMRLKASGNLSLPITMINDYIGIRNVTIKQGAGDTLIFGGDFLEYAKIKASPEGRILLYDGTATPWNYIVTRHDPIDVDEMAKRMSKKRKIGIPSPKNEVDFVLGSDTINLSYSRPQKRGRTIFGGVVPYDSIWRTGANDPTKLRFPSDVFFGKTLIPKGEYSIYTIPGKAQWVLIFNADLKQWPTEPDRSKDVAMIPMRVQNMKQITEQFTMVIEPVKGGGILKMYWDDIEVSTNFKMVRKDK